MLRVVGRVCFLVLVVCCVLFAGCCWVRDVCCVSLGVVCCSFGVACVRCLGARRCVLFVVGSLMLVVCCVLSVVR